MVTWSRTDPRAFFCRGNRLDESADFPISREGGGAKSREKQKSMYHSRIVGVLDAIAGGLEAIGIGQSIIMQRVVLGGDHKSRGQAAQIIGQ